MDDVFDEIQRNLPTYLSGPSRENLFKELKQFPTNIDSRLYTDILKKEANLFQGDGLKSMWVAHLPSERLKKTRVMVVSNTCDVDRTNRRFQGARILYCPIVDFGKYDELIRRNAQGHSEESINGHIEAIRLQKISDKFFLPARGLLKTDAIALLDHINNCDSRVLDQAAIEPERLFSLSDYGFYLFLFKLSIHLTRIREGVSRN